MNLDRFSYTLHRPGVDWEAMRERLEEKADRREQERKDSEQDMVCPICSEYFNADAPGALVALGGPVDVIRCPKCMKRERKA